MTEEICPGCGRELRGLASFCHTCKEYVEDMRQEEAGPELSPAATPPDTRPEDERRIAVREALERVPGTPDWPQGFIILDFEQNRKGTRVRLGLADLYVMGFGASVWAEMKTDKGTQSDDQIAFQLDCQACGIPYFVWRNEGEALDWALKIRAQYA